MLGPCCLCPLIDENGSDYVEAAMYMATIGPYAGQCVISCANDICEYLGKCKTWSAIYKNRYQVLIICLVLSEKLYDRPGIHLKVYESRG